MEGLLAEINAKRKALEIEAGPSDGPAKKYMRRADIEKAREEEERKKRMEDAVRKEALKAEGKAYKARKEVSNARSFSRAVHSIL
jgi:pre-mRNA-splicing factor 18